MYNITGMNQLVEAINMIHILNFSYDGITGISTLKHARNTLGLTADSEAHAEGFSKVVLIWLALLKWNPH